MERKRRILVIDDEQEVLDMLQNMLEDEGYEVDVAVDGETGMDLMKLSPDLVLLDIKLPNLNGYQVLELIRNQSEVPVIMLTGIVEPVSVYHSVNLGADDYVLKPFSLRILSARIKNKLRRAGSGIYNKTILG